MDVLAIFFQPSHWPVARQPSVLNCVLKMTCPTCSSKMGPANLQRSGTCAPGIHFPKKCRNWISTIAFHGIPADIKVQHRSLWNLSLSSFDQGITVAVDSVLLTHCRLLGGQSAPALISAVLWTTELVWESIGSGEGWLNKSGLAWCDHGMVTPRSWVDVNTMALASGYIGLGLAMSIQISGATNWHFFRWVFIACIFPHIGLNPLSFSSERWARLASTTVIESSCSKRHHVNLNQITNSPALWSSSSVWRHGTKPIANAALSAEQRSSFSYSKHLQHHAARWVLSSL